MAEENFSEFSPSHNMEQPRSMRVEDLLSLLAQLLERKGGQTEISQNQRSSKALQNIVKRHERFNGRNITTFLRHYVCEMELNRFSNLEMIGSFELAVVPEIRSQIRRLSSVIT